MSKIIMNTFAKAPLGDNPMGRVTGNDNALKIVFHRHVASVEKVWARRYFLAGFLAVAVAAEAGVPQAKNASSSKLTREEKPMGCSAFTYVSYTVAGADPKVRALVYVAALQPDVGETTNQLAATIPGTLPISDLKPTKDGFIFIDPTKFVADIANDLPVAQAAYLSNSQMPVAAAAFDAQVTIAAWHDKPSYGIVATADRALNPMLARWMYKRSRAKVTEIKANHLVYISQPIPIASVIEAAARSVSARSTKTT